MMTTKTKSVEGGTGRDTKWLERVSGGCDPCIYV